MRLPALKLKWCFTCRDSVRVPLNAEERGAVQGEVPYWGANSIQDYVRESLFNEELVLLGEDGAPFFDPLRDVAFHITEPIWPNNHVHVLLPKPHVDARYMTYALNSAVDYSLYVGGATRDKLTQGAMDNIDLPCPVKEMQTAIADFLDCKTAAIDTLIAKKEELIRELDAYREAVIAEAVAPREGWRKMRLKHLVTALPKSKLPAGAATEDGVVPFFVSGATTKKTVESTFNGVALMMADGGKAVVHLGKGIFAWSDHVVALEPKDSSLADFLYFQMVSKLSLIDAVGFRGTGLPMLDKRWAFDELVLSLPSEAAEACAIGAELARLSQTIATAVAKAEESIAMLKEYRASLISEAVTGKLVLTTP